AESLDEITIGIEYGNAMVRVLRYVHAPIMHRDADGGTHPHFRRVEAHQRGDFLPVCHTRANFFNDARANCALTDAVLPYLRRDILTHVHIHIFGYGPI